jgi:cell division protein FtsQ
LSTTGGVGPVRPAPRPAPRPAHAGVAIDPRIRARRIGVLRDAGRRRLRRVIDVGVVLLVAAAFAIALRSPLLAVRTVRVTGASHVSASEVAQQSGIRTGEQLVDVDLAGAGRRIEALPWVATVTLTRSMGGTVGIRVTERAPAAVVGDGAGAVVVDATGRVLARVSDVPTIASGLIRVAGLPSGLAPGDEVPGSPGDALALAGRLAAAVPGAISQVSVGPELLATLAQGGQVRFGDTTDLAAKLRSLQTVLDEVDLTCLGVLDVRVPANPVLTRRAGCS